MNQPSFKERGQKADAVLGRANLVRYSDWFFGFTAAWLFLAGVEAAIISQDVEYVMFGVVRALLLLPFALVTRAAMRKRMKTNEKGSQSRYAELGERADAIVKQADAIVDKVRSAAEKSAAFQQERKGFLEATNSSAKQKPVGVVILGGTGWDHLKGRKQLVSLCQDRIRFSDPETLTHAYLDLADIEDIEISGPGTVTSDAGMIGGGFGAGALAGIALASVVNLLTAHKNTKTFIRISAKHAEVVMLTEELDLQAARLLLSEAFLAARKAKADPTNNGISAELLRLHDLKVQGVLTEEEFGMAKRKIIASGSATLS